MKIGIMTFWWSNDNYGQLLQCYALQKYLRNMGHDAFVIKYNHSSDIKKNSFASKFVKAFNPKEFIKHLMYLHSKAAVKREQKKFNREFSDFRSKYIHMSQNEYSSYQELKLNPPVADAYIVGSDQVWCFRTNTLSRFRNPLHAYFLDFGMPETKRISYAASWGRTQIDFDYQQEISSMLKNFDYISVREESGINLCRKCGCLGAEWVCDPTLLLSAQNYRTLYKENKIRKPEKAFVFLYLLNNTQDFDIQNVYDFAASKKLDIVYVTGNNVIDNHKKYFATIPEWLWLVDNANYVITNSFHCAVFSTIFHKAFGVIKLKGNKEESNTRFESLFKFLETGNRYLFENDFSVLEKKYESKNIKVSESFLEALK